MIAHTRAVRDVRECSVAVIVIKNGAAIVRDIEVKVSIVIVITPRRAHSVPAVVGHACLESHIGKRAVVVVAVQMAVGRAGAGLRSPGTRLINEIKVRPAVVVVVAPGNAGAHIFRKLVRAGSARVDKMNSGLPRNVGENDRRMVRREVPRRAVKHKFLALRS